MNDLQLEKYNLHLLIVKDFNVFELEEWNSFLNFWNDKHKMTIKLKITKLNRKLNNILKDKPNILIDKVKPKYVDELVFNLSSKTFNNDEMNLLNKGLKFTPFPNKINFKEIVANIESSIQFKNENVKHNIRDDSKTILQEYKSNKAIMEQNFDTKTKNIIAELCNKDCYFIKADKGNKIVIMDKTDYLKKMEDMCIENNYIIIKKTPLPKMIRECNDLIKIIKNNFDVGFRHGLNISNPIVPRLYGLPKIHKQGNKMRPIVSSINSPCYKIAKWLINELKILDQPISKSIKNSFQLVKRLENVELDDNDILVSFDIISLFPNVPIVESLIAMDEWLDLNNIEEEKKKVYLATAKLCMNHSFFQFNHKFYKLDQGANMGNPLSPLMAELFLAKFETTLENNNLLPVTWIRYVDDVLAITSKNKVDSLLDVLNSQFPSIKFTVEIENDSSINFLDLKLKRINKKIVFDVFRKETSTIRFLTNDSYNPIQHKHAVFHSLAYRLVNLPLSQDCYASEYEFIKQAATVNGYERNLIDNIINKHHRQKLQNDKSTLFVQNKKLEKKLHKYTKMIYAPDITNKLIKIYKNNDMELVFKSGLNLKNLLGSTKDKLDELDKSGIYEIACSDCDHIYIGKTSRNLKTRFKEHIGHAKHNNPLKSSVAQHMLEANHFNFDLNNIKLLKSVTDNFLLDAYESIFINDYKKKNQNLLNGDNGNIVSSLFDFL